MKSASACFPVIVTVVVLAGFSPKAVASASFGATTWGCSYDSNGITANLSATGAVAFSVNGHCKSGPNPTGVVIGKLLYDPATNRFTERLIFIDATYKNEIDTTGFCQANPWTTPASRSCSNQMVSIQGDFGAADTDLSSSASLAPLSLVAIPEMDFSGNVLVAVQQLFVGALAQASRPNPPANPVLVQVQSLLQQPFVSIRWRAPDESGNRPFTHFVVQARNAAVSGAPWVILGDTPRNTSGSYLVTFRLPDATGSAPQWFITACSATALAITCSAPVAPGPAMAEYTAAGTMSLGTFIPPPMPLDVRFAAWATRVTAAWKLSGKNPNVIDDYSVEENDGASQIWRHLGTVPRSSSQNYSTHVVRAASYSSWLRVCAERQTMRSCSQPVRVTSTPPQQSLQNDRNAFRMQIPPAPIPVH